MKNHDRFRAHFVCAALGDVPDGHQVGNARPGHSGTAAWRWPTTRARLTSSACSMWRWSHLIAAVAKKEILYAGPFGVAAWLAGVVFIDRLNSDKARGQLEHSAQLMSKKNVKLWLFPEGTRNKKRGIMPFKKGAFLVAVACQAPIMPVVYSPYYFVNPHNKFRTGGLISINSN
jgi:1-acyl-sn-glycerol-3-phosphate acyltransferase